MTFTLSFSKSGYDYSDPFRNAQRKHDLEFIVEPNDYDPNAAESQADGVRLAERIESRYLVPTVFSPVK